MLVAFPETRGQYRPGPSALSTIKIHFCSVVNQPKVLGVKLLEYQSRHATIVRRLATGSRQGSDEPSI